MKKAGIFLLAVLVVMLFTLSSCVTQPSTPEDESGDIIVAVGVEGIDIFDVSDPTNPKHLSHLESKWVAEDVFVKDNYAYVAAGSLLIVDIADPRRPKIKVEYSTNGWARGVHVVDNYAYITNGDGLKIIDVTYPSDPEHVGYYETPGDSRGVYVKDNYAYVADGNNGLVIVDVIDPDTPSFVRSVDTDGYADDLYVEGNYVYLTDWNNGLVIIDVTDHENPDKACVVPIDSEMLWGVQVRGEYAYIVGWISDGLVVVDISIPKESHIETSVPLFDNGREIFIKNNYAYIAEPRGMEIVEITNLNDPKVVGRYETNEYAYGISIGDNVAYVADAGNGLILVDVTTPYNPQEIGFYEYGGISDVDIAGNYSYLAGDEGLIIVDVTDTSSPEEVGRYGESGWLKGVYVDDDYAYVVSGENKLVVLNITEGSAPTFFGELDLNAEIEGTVEDVFVKDNYAYVSCGYDGLVIVDVSDPLNPDIVGSYEDENIALAGIYIDENYAYAATLWNGLKIIEGLDVNNLENAQIVGNFFTRKEACDVWVEGDYAYIANDDNGLVIVDVSNPQSPVLAADMPWKAFYGISGN